MKQLKNTRKLSLIILHTPEAFQRKNRRITGKNLELAANSQDDSIRKNMKIHQIRARNIQNCGLYGILDYSKIYFPCKISR